MASDPINFDIDSLIARYQLHPDRRDLFVEGEADQGLLRVFLEKQNRSNISVFPISVVNIPDELIAARALPQRSRRSEVITLAFELGKRGIAINQVTCIADADFDHLLSSVATNPLLLFTDFTSMEIYAFSPEAVHTLLIMLSPKTQKRGEDLLADLGGPLQFLFLARFTNYDLKFGLAWIDGIEKFFSIKDKRIMFDEAEFLRRYLLLRLPATKAALFNARLQELFARASVDVRFQIRGHDFIRMLTWFLRKGERCAHLNEESVRQMLYMGLIPQSLEQHQLFRTLLARFPK